MAQLAASTVASLDQALERQLRGAFGPKWRTMCYHAGKVAADALQLLFPKEQIMLARVELIAYMEGAPSFVHVGWLEDTRKIESKIPAHFAVVIGSDLYDPAFKQLETATTPLDLPAEPYFYVADFFEKNDADKEGFRWVGCNRPTGLLKVGYKLQPAPLSAASQDLLLPDSLALRHARRVADFVQ